MQEKQTRMSLVKQVVAINWGTKYGARFINRLYAMVERNITPPFTFTCFTDNREGIRPEVLCEDLPPIDARMHVNSKGIWQKSRCCFSTSTSWSSEASIRSFPSGRPTR